MKLAPTLHLAAVASSIAAAALSVAAPMLAQTAATVPLFPDPANLRGERVSPHTDRDLPIDQGERGLEQMLRRLGTRASVLNIVAHPDDEDGGMLTLVSRGLGARVTDLSLTRGEGGQNAMTGDFEDALGLLRTQELLASDRYPGIGQYFGTEVDFGFSKTKEEAFRKWTHERVLYDAVRAVRLFRPLVITATFIGGVTDGHGQHQVSGEIAQEAFKAAADPHVFPEMIAEGILPWQALKVYARVPQGAITERGLFDYATGQYAPATFTNYVTGEVTTTIPSVDVVVHEGTVDALLSGPAEPPRSYVQFARFGLGLQKSQIGPGIRSAPAGAFDVAYHRYGSMLQHQPAVETDFFSGIDTSLAGLAASRPGAGPELKSQLQALDQEVKQISDWNVRADGRDGIPRLLADLVKRVDLTISIVSASTLPDQDKFDLLHELRVKRVQANDALVLALGLRMEASTPQPGNIALNLADSIPLRVTLTTTSKEPITFLTPSQEPVPFNPVWLKASGGTLTSAQPLTVELRALSHGGYDQPYFSRPDIEQPFYNLNATTLDDLRNAPVSPPSLFTYGYVRYDDAIIDMAAAPPTKLVPSISVALQSHAQVLPEGQKTFSLPVHVHREGVTAQDMMLRLSLPAGWTAAPQEIKLRPEHGVPATDFDRTFSVTPEGHFSAAYNAPPVTVSATVTAHDGSEEETVAEGYRPVGYGDLPRTNYYTPAAVRIVPVDLKLPARRRIGYLPGTGDAVPEALASVGLPVTMLSVAQLTPAGLAAFDTVILGVRTYNAHPDLHGAPTQALLDFARGGGNVVLQYQTTEFTAADAPYSLSLGSNEKVVDETAPVKLLAPGSPLLSSPNVITDADFAGWIEERGHGFMGTWDPHYTVLTETGDPGSAAEHVAPQLPQRGGLLTVGLGKGRWTYCAFALYRQLPEAVPGGFRMFLNLLGSSSPSTD